MKHTKCVRYYYLLTFYGCFSIGNIFAENQIMMGEPLTPRDFESGAALVISASAELDINYREESRDDIDIKRNESGLRNGTFPWPNAIVPYLLDSKFNSTERALIASAIASFHKVTCVRMYVRTVEPDYIVFQKGESNITFDCTSAIGIQGGRQVVTLSPRCIGKGGPLHELMHVLGFFHEMNRRNRDDYVTIFYENILPVARPYFEKYDTPGNNFSPYDISSITHYPKRAYSINKKPTILAKVGDGPSGQRNNLTRYDIQKVNGYYQCRIAKIKASASVYMHSVLQSRVCADFDEPYCSLWTQLGFCNKSSIFMSVFCKDSCNQCGIQCRDFNKSCSAWAKKKYCSKYADYMYQYCQKSCKKCNQKLKIK